MSLLIVQQDSSVGLAWEGPLQKELIDLPDARLPDEDIVFDQPAVSNNVTPMRPPGSPDTEVAGS